MESEAAGIVSNPNTLVEDPEASDPQTEALQQEPQTNEPVEPANEKELAVRKILEQIS